MYLVVSDYVLYRLFIKKIDLFFKRIYTRVYCLSYAAKEKQNYKS